MALQKKIKVLQKESTLEWANNLLRYAISFLRGENVEARVKTRVQMAIILRNRFSKRGLWWQVKVLDYWIHRAQRGEFGA